MAVSPFAPLESATVAAQIQQRLEAAIYSGQLKPGERLLEVDLAEAMQVSRASFREALRLLQSKGLVVNTHRRGTYVVELTATDVREICTVRCLLEAFAIRHATQRQDPDLIARLVTLVESLGDAAGQRDHLRIIDLDLDIHHALCEATGNRTLLASWGNLVAPARALLLTKYRLFDDSPDIAYGHQRLIDVIQSGNPDHAETLLRDHIVITAEQVIDAMAHEAAQAAPTERTDGAGV